MEKILTTGTSVAEAGFAAIFTSFLSETVGHMIPWLLVTLAVILCDLAVGIRYSVYKGEEVRFSTAIRRTMGKIVSYFTFVVTVCMINVACGNEYPIERFACLFVCFVEGCSIMGNILKPKGIDFNVIKGISILCSKVMRVDKEEVVEILTNNEKEEKEEKQ